MIFGYSDFSLIRASSAVNYPSTDLQFSLCSLCHMDSSWRRISISSSSVQTLVRHRIQPYLCYIQPAPMLRGVVESPSGLPAPPPLWRGTPGTGMLLYGCSIHHKDDLFLIRIYFCQYISDLHCPVQSCPAFPHTDMTPSREYFREHEDAAGPTAFILCVYFLISPGLAANGSLGFPHASCIT